MQTSIWIYISHEIVMFWDRVGCYCWNVNFVRNALNKKPSFSSRRLVVMIR